MGNLEGEQINSHLKYNADILVNYIKNKHKMSNFRKKNLFPKNKKIK